MNSATGQRISSPRVVVDTNVLVSAITFGGVPGKIWEQILSKDINAITSPILLTELFRILGSKMKLSLVDLDLIRGQINDVFVTLYPREILNVLTDDPDNRVLEAAIEGNCEYIITGDKKLLELKKHRGIKIITPADFASWTKLKAGI